MGKQTSLPKKAKIGTEITRIVKVKGKKRRITWKKTPKHGKNRNLGWKIKSNKPTK
jgi:hypothetical protein